MRDIIYIGLGGCIGSILRYLCSLPYPNNSLSFPLATLFVNLIGSFIIGSLFIIVLENPTKWVNGLLITGFCGGFTTFSTFSLENLKLLQNGKYTLAIVYTFTSVLGGIIMALLGCYFSKKILM